MALSHNTDLASPLPLRLWPGVVLVALQWFLRFGVLVIFPEALPAAVLGSMLCGLGVVVWWVFLSRAPWIERLGGLGLMAVAMGVTPFFIHESIANGMMGLMFPVYAVPVMSLAFVLWAVLGRRLVGSTRWATMAAAIFVGCGVWALARTGGFSSDLDHDFAWRWTQTPEDRLLAGGDDQERGRPALLAADETAAEWVGFRGPRRDGILRGIQIETDWTSSPPVELWRRAIGPGWSSFAVQGSQLFTQEQRGEEEVVSCYDLRSGVPIWKHRDTARFWESNGGAGPRGTPTLHEGRVYTLGGTGIVNALEAQSGALVWSRDAAADTGAKLPVWGFSGSPLVVDDIVIVAASGTLVAYDLANGNPRWTGAPADEGYSSPHLVTLDGVPQIVHLNGDGLVGVSIADGRQLWNYSWSGYPIVQPALTDDGDLLLAVDQGLGMRRVAVRKGTGGWTVQERWKSIRMKPWFNDYVVHKGHVFGFDGSILACMDVAEGKRKWKGGRYGSGQLVLLADQDVLLVQAEKGDLVLVRAGTDRFKELARVPALEGKTWNHPVLVGDVLVVRNSQEMVAYRLTLAAG